MSDHVERTLEMVQGQISDLERQLSEKKKIANGLCQLAGLRPMYAQAEPDTYAALRADEFYGKPLATAVEEVLERRKRSGQGAAPVPEIFEMLTRGGFHFNTKNVDNAKRGLYTSLSKNPKFHKLPNGTYGLASWYPKIKGPREADEEEEVADGDDASEVPKESAMSVIAGEVAGNGAAVEAPDVRQKPKPR